MENMKLILTSLLILQFLAIARSDFLRDCPHLCSCKWSGGKKLADCSNKGFTTIPQSISSEVQVLNMDGNYIKELTKDSFSSVGLLHLNKISMKDCKIQKIDDNAFSKLKILTDINLDRNNISKLPAKLFDGNERLQSLILSNNKISTLVANQFPPLRALKKIDLSNSELKTINVKSFLNLGDSLETVNLHGNNLQTVKERTFTHLIGLKYLSLDNNPWHCDCRLKNFRDFVVQKNMLMNPSSTRCSDPDRLADKLWTDVNSMDFACKPSVEVDQPVVVGRPRTNATLHCKITGNPVPAVKWVLNGRIIQNNTVPLHSNNQDKMYFIDDVALSEGGIERNFSLTITAADNSDLGDYSCVAINKGGMAERNITLTFTGVNVAYSQKMTIIIGVAAGALLILIIFIIVLCCCCRKRGKGKTGHSLNGSVLGYNTDPAGEKLLPPNGTLNRANPVPKPDRTGDYHRMGDHQMVDYGPASYVPGDRYDEYGEGRNSASNSDQTGTLSRASYHSSDPDHYPDLLDIPARFKQPSPSSTASTLYETGRLPHHGLHHQPPHGLHQPLHPVHLISPPHLHHHHHVGPFQRTGTLPHNFSTGTLPHHHHPRSVSCDHTGAGYGPIIQTTQNARPGYVTLPRRPRGSWAGQQPPRDTPSPAFSLRDPIYDGVGPRTGASGSSSVDLNKSLDNGVAIPKVLNGGARFTTLPPLCPPIKEEVPFPPPTENGGPQHNSTPNILDMSEGGNVNKRSPITSLLTAGSDQTINEPEENLSAYFEPFGLAMVPASPGNRDSIASCESDSLLVAEKKDEEEASSASSPLNSTPRLNTSHGPSPGLDTIPEGDIPDLHSGKKLPPPTLPKPKKVSGPKVGPPAPPPKPRKRTEPEQTNGDSAGSFQDETCDGSEVE